MIPSCGNSDGVRGTAIKSDKKMYLRGACGSHELQSRSLDLETYNRGAAPSLLSSDIWGLFKGSLISPDNILRSRLALVEEEQRRECISISMAAKAPSSFKCHQESPEILFI